MSDRRCGAFLLAFSLAFLGYLLLRLVVAPVLPLDERHEKMLLPPTYILLTLATCGFAFVGFLTAFTLKVLYDVDVRVAQKG